MDFTPFEHDGLILFSDLARAGIGGRDTSTAVARGQLIRLRRGAYVRVEVWRATPPRERHVLRVRAVAAAARATPTLARASAAALWGIPLDDYPADVVVLDRWRGGGRSEPGVTRTARGATTARLVVREGFHCTDLARTVLDVARELSFADAVMLFDWSLGAQNPSPITKADLMAEASRLKVSPALWKAAAFSTHLSGSKGESRARAVIYLLGYPQPVLQKKFVDSTGAMYPDFHFEDANVAAEFDGKMKYTRDEYTKGDPAEAVWKEKKREDRLRRQVRTVVRILTHDVENPAVLDQKLREAGIRRVRGGSA